MIYQVVSRASGASFSHKVVNIVTAEIVVDGLNGQQAADVAAALNKARTTGYQDGVVATSGYRPPVVEATTSSDKHGY